MSLTRSIASDINDCYLLELSPLYHFELSDINITVQDIQDQFDTLNRNKPSGSEGILPISS